ncbi:PAS domain S-box protein [Stutzerimonas tarimensis]|uniref:histidine kinase n=1 Tax=Stutzerimonas tarimensis TaxID=1507735 RepID=A0ABV7T3W5_9GAMM
MITLEASQVPPPGDPVCSELSRLAALLRYEILDTPDESEFDDFTQLAAYICKTPIALISLVDEHRQWFKSRYGLTATSTPRALSFCHHTIRGSEIFEVPDATEDPRFRENPLVTSAPNICFYAGAPLITPDGHNLGTLCVIDRQPRQLDEEQRAALERLSRQVIRLFEQRLLTRQHAEQATLQRVMLDNATNALLMMDRDGRIEQANPAATRLFGYSGNGLTGRDFCRTLFFADTLKEQAARLSLELERPIEPGFAALTEPLRRGQREQRSWRLRHRTGSEIPLLLSLSAIPDAHGDTRGYLAIGYDLTLQEQLQLRLQQIAAQVPGMLFQYHWKPGGGGFTYASEGIEAVYGLSPGQLVEHLHPILERVHPDDRAPMLDTLRHAAEQRIPWQHEHRATHPRRGLLWLDARATPLCQADGSVLWHGLVTDVSERKAQQAELEKQQEMTRRLIESLSEGVIACDAEGRLALLNDKARQWFGETYPSHQPSWLDAMSLFDSEGARPLSRDEIPLTRALRGEVVANAELTILNNGSPRFLLTSADPLYASDGSRIGAVTVMHDISERKRNERLQREFVSTVSHELRTPLTSISGSLALICSEVMGEVPAHLRELLDIANQNSQRLNALINDLLDIDKLNAGKLRVDLYRQPLQPLLQQAVRANQAYADRYGVTLELSSASAARVRADALRLHQVLTNLLSNAAKFSPAGGTVSMETRQTGQWVRVTVRDQGQGIDESFRDRVFQRFAQADSSDTRAQGGTGLGLAISKALIERMNGRIGYDSQPGKGASFWFDLPLDDEDDA